MWFVATLTIGSAFVKIAFLDMDRPKPTMKFHVDHNKVDVLNQTKQ